MTLMKLFDDYNPDYVCAAFDLKAPIFRHKMYKEYKAGRKPMPDALREQIPIAKDILRVMGICVLEKEGFEVTCYEEEVFDFLVDEERDDPVGKTLFQH